MNASDQYKIGDSRVVESRESPDGTTIRRRRETPDGRRFTTFERVEKPDLTVVKKDGRRELYEHEKLYTAVKRSVGKFFKSELEVDDLVTNVEHKLYQLGETEIPASAIGDTVLDELARHNEVAYVRFASVYREFKTLDEFEAILSARKKSNKERA